MAGDWLELPEPRGITAAERAVLDRLVAIADSPALAVQAATVSVTAACGCGCGSVRLWADGAPLSPAEMSRLSSAGQADWFSIDSTRTDPSGPVGNIEIRLFQVVLHVVDGSLHELEIFAGDDVSTEPPPPDELTDITLT